MGRRKAAARVIAVFYGSRGMPFDEIAALVRWHCGMRFRGRDVEDVVAEVCYEEYMSGNRGFFDDDTAEFDIEKVDKWLINQTNYCDLSRSRLYELIDLDDDATEMLFDVSICSC